VINIGIGEQCILLFFLKKIIWIFYDRLMDTKYITIAIFIFLIKFRNYYVLFLKIIWIFNDRLMDTKTFGFFN
jgi:hypothetical protein